MQFITVTELKQRATQIVTEVEKTKDVFIVTKNGRPVVKLSFITDDVFVLKDQGGS